MRIVQVGGGARGKKWARTVQEEPAVETVAYVDVELGSLREWARQAGEAGARCYSQLAPALDEIKPDALLIVTAPTWHYEQIMAALGRPIVVLVEKPMEQVRVSLAHRLLWRRDRSHGPVRRPLFGWFPGSAGLERSLVQELGRSRRATTGGVAIPPAFCRRYPPSVGRICGGNPGWPPRRRAAVTTSKRRYWSWPAFGRLRSGIRPVCQTFIDPSESQSGGTSPGPERAA
jgi:hypothetical protein